MEAILITFTRNGQPVRDLEVPHEAPVQEWLQQVTSVGKEFYVETEDLDRYQIEACSPAGSWRRLRPEQSLADVGIWDGAFLRLHEGGFGTSASTEAVAGWKPILAEDGSLYQEEDDDLLGTIEFSWKKLE